MIGNLIVILSIVGTLVLFGASKIGLALEPKIWIIFAQISGLVASLLIAWNFILATRMSFVEKIFEGLDKVYKIHNLLGHIAFILVINHPLFLIINSLPFNTSKLYLVPSLNNLPYLFGILALYLLIFLVTLTIFIDIPYKYWKKTHEYMGLVIILGSIHSLLITSDISRYFPLRIWILAWSGVAIMAFIYKRFIYYLIRRKNNYIVSEVVHEKNYLLLTLVPTDSTKFLTFKPGQFAFFSSEKRGREEHPFSVLEQDGAKIKIGTKTIGDFTLALSDIKAGEYLSVNGPYGVFGDTINKARDLVMISGGIGITPFLSMIKAATGKQVTMIHTSHSTDSNLFVNIFKSYSYYFPNFKFIHHASDILGRLNEKIIATYANLSPGTYVYLCGPEQMMNSLSEGLPKSGIHRRRIIFEDFKLK